VTEGEDRDRRGSHATTLGQGFSWVLLWTILGALIPGSGLIAAGRRWIGSLLLIVIALGGLLLAGVALLGDRAKRAESFAVDSQKLLILAVVVAIVAFGWVVVVVLTNTELRRHTRLTSTQGVFSWLLVVALIVGIGIPAYSVSRYALITRGVVDSKSIFQADTDSTSTRPNAQQEDPWAAKPRENVLLIGSDAGKDRTGVRPDTLILASIDTKTGNTVMFSLPRSLQHVPFPLGTGGNEAWPDGFYCPTVGDGETCLLNAIWTWAEGDGKRYYGKYKHPGLRATQDAVEGVTGLRVDTYVMLNLEGFKEFVDALGGVTLDVHERLPIGGDTNHPVATGGYIEKGDNQHMTGERSLWFARSRWSTGDYDRMQRQRCVISAVMDQADPVKLALAFPKIAKTLHKNLATGIPSSELQAWVDLSQRVKGATVTSLPFTDDVISTVKPNFDKIHKLVADAITASTLPKVTTTPSPSASASSSPTPSQNPTKKKKKKKNPARAQDVKAVC
jgi:LCP family protein required for cell wall assembly